MSYAIIDPMGIKTVKGYSKISLVLNTDLFEFDTDDGKLYLQGKADTITYSDSYAPDEMMHEMANRAIKIMKGWGWTLYKSVD